MPHGRLWHDAVYDVCDVPYCGLHHEKSIAPMYAEALVSGDIPMPTLSFAVIKQVYRSPDSELKATHEHHHACTHQHKQHKDPISQHYVTESYCALRRCW